MNLKGNAPRVPCVWVEDYPAEGGVTTRSRGRPRRDIRPRSPHGSGGALNPTQPALIQAAIERMGEGAEIVIATDNDPDGRKLADAIEALARETGRGDLRLIQDLPPREGQDWNDVLRQRGESPPAGATLDQAGFVHGK